MFKYLDFFYIKNENIISVYHHFDHLKSQSSKKQPSTISEIRKRESTPKDQKKKVNHSMYSYSGFKN